MRLPLVLALCLVIPCQAAQPLIERITIAGPARTRAETIRRELLFAAGQVFDSSLVAETERNLRQLPFLGQVGIRTLPSPGGVEVIVEVEDLYARVLSPLLAGQPGELSYGAVALDYNLGGRGHLARIEFQHRAIEGDALSLAYRVPRLPRSAAALGATVSWAQEGHDLALELSHPFRSLRSRWAYGVSLYHLEAVDRLYEGQQLSARYQATLAGGSIWLTRSAGARTKVRPGFRLVFADRRYAASRGHDYAPEDRQRLVPSLGLTLWRPRYVQEVFLHELGRAEDLQVGGWTAVRAGLSLRALGSDRDFAPVSFQLSPRWQPWARAYAAFTLAASTQLEPGHWRELYLSAETTTHARFGARHSLALRLRAESLARPEQRAQYLLGADSGLRGFLPRRFAGHRRALANLEVRPFFCLRPAWALAGALFADGGMAWSGKAPAWRFGAGAGLRLGLPRLYNTPILRADLARGLPRGSWLLSLGLGQYF